MESLPVHTPKSGKSEVDGPISPISKSANSTITSETLQPQVMQGDKLNHAAAALIISDDDIKRWSKVAGITVPANVQETGDSATAAAVTRRCRAQRSGWWTREAATYRSSELGRLIKVCVLPQDFQSVENWGKQTMRIAIRTMEVPGPGMPN